jgi:hypothetical protein
MTARLTAAATVVPSSCEGGASAMSNGSAPAAAKAGIGFGSALAITISWSANKSILWAIVHGFLSWIYVIYYALKYQ